MRILGPALWANEVGRLGKLDGAWYAALDPAARQGFAAAFQGKYGVTPPALADFAFDGAAIAAVLAQQNDFSPAPSPAPKASPAWTARSA